MVSTTFGGPVEEIPFDKVLAQRLQIGAVLGLLFDLPDDLKEAEDAQYINHAMVTLKKIMSILGKLESASVGETKASLKKLTTPLIWTILRYDSATSVEAIEILVDRHYNDEAMGEYDLSDEMDNLIDDYPDYRLLNDLKELNGDNPDMNQYRHLFVNREKADRIKIDILKALHSLYMKLEPPLIVKISSRRPSIANLNNPQASESESEEETQEHSLNFYTQAPGPTQAPMQFSPDDLLATTQPVANSQMQGTQGSSACPETSPAVFPKSPWPPEDSQIGRFDTTQNIIQVSETPQLIESTQLLESTQIIEPTQNSDNEADEEPEQFQQPITHIPLGVFRKLFQFCDDRPEDFFAQPDPVLDECYRRLALFQADLVRDTRAEMPPMSSLLPTETSPVQEQKRKKRISFESDFEEDEKEKKEEEEDEDENEEEDEDEDEDNGKDAKAELKREERTKQKKQKKKKSMLLPDASAHRLEWSSHSPSNENTALVSASAKNSSSLSQPPSLTPIKVASASASAISATALASSPASSSTTTTRLVAKPTGKSRRPWSVHEKENLKEGLRRFGRKWSIILASYKFNERTQVDLKDKARNMVRAGEIVLPPQK